MRPWIGRQRYDGVQEEGVVLRSSRRLGASPRKVNVMSRDLFTGLRGWVGLKVCAFLWSQQGRIYTKIRNIHPGRSAFSMSKYPLESGGRLVECRFRQRSMCKSQGRVEGARLME